MSKVLEKLTTFKNDTLVVKDGSTDNTYPAAQADRFAQFGKCGKK